MSKEATLGRPTMSDDNTGAHLMLDDPCTSTAELAYALDDDLDGEISKTHKTALKAERRRQRLAELDATKDDPELSEFMELIPRIKPHNRAECMVRQRPCIFVSCKYHLYLDVNPNTGTIKFNFPDLEPWEIPETCALDIADKGGTTLEEIGDLMNLTRERVRQLEAIVLDKIKREEDKRALLDLDEELACLRGSSSTRDRQFAEEEDF